MTEEITKIQQTLFGEKIIIEYLGINHTGKIIRIPNYQPIPTDNNPRLDIENTETKRKSDT